MKRVSIGCGQLPAVSESLAYICTLLSSFGLQHLSPQTLLLAAANHPSAAASMWYSLHQLICLQLASPSTSRPVENVLLSRGEEDDTSPDGVTGFVKFYLSLWGFSYTSPVFCTSHDTEESQSLLLALAWLMSKCDILNRALKARIEKLTPHFSPPMASDVSKTSTAVDRARQARVVSENYVNKLIRASNRLADAGLRARARTQQVLMLYGRVRMSIMGLHSLLSTKAKLIHNLNQIQLDRKIKNGEGNLHTQFDLHLLQHRDELEKHFEALQSMKLIGDDVLHCQKHEKTFWQWMVAIILSRETHSCPERGPSSQELQVLSKFCAVSILPVTKTLKDQMIDKEHTREFNSDSVSVKPRFEDPTTNLKQLSFPETDIEDVRRLYEKIHFRFQGVTFVYETAPTGSLLPQTTNSDADSIVERLKLVATSLVQALAQTRIRNRTCLEDIMNRYFTESYVLHNF